MPLAVAPEWQVKLLTDVLCHCIDKSRASSQIIDPRRRTVVEGLVRQHMPADGPLDLHEVWQAVLHEPGVTERALASAFAAMEDLEKALPLPLTPTQRLQALNPVQRQALLGEAPIVRSEIERMLRNARIEAQLAGMRAPKIQTGMMQAIGGAPPAQNPQNARLTAALMAVPMPRPGSEAALAASGPPVSSAPADAATKEARLAAARALLEKAALEIQMEAFKGRSNLSAVLNSDPQRPRTAGDGPRPRATGAMEAVSARGSAADKKGPKGADKKGAAAMSPGRRLRLVAAVVLSLVAVGAIGSQAYMALHSDPVPAFDVSGVTGLRLSAGVTPAPGTVHATLDDPRWRGMTSDARKEAVLKAFAQVQGRGVHVLVLRDADQALQAQAGDNLPGATVKSPRVMLSGAPPGKK